MWFVRRYQISWPANCLVVSPTMGVLPARSVQSTITDRCVLVSTHLILLCAVGNQLFKSCMFPVFFTATLALLGLVFTTFRFFCCCSFIVFSSAWTLHNCNLNVHIICCPIDLLYVIIFWLSPDTAIMTACVRQREGSSICRVGEGSADQRSDIPVEWIHLRLLCRHFQGKYRLIDWQMLISFYPYRRKTTWLTFLFGQHGHVVQPVSTVP